MYQKKFKRSYDRNWLDYVMVDELGGLILPDYITPAWKRLLEKNNVRVIRFHDLRHTTATNMHQLTGDFYTVGEILGHTLKEIGMSLGISTSLEAVTAQYVDVRLERKRDVLSVYHRTLQPQNNNAQTNTKTQNNKNDIEL